MEIYKENHKITIHQKDKEIAVATFPQYREHVVNIDHTFVDPALRGQGIASQLMQAVVEYLRDKALKTVATCPYAVVWFKRHKEALDVLDEVLQAELSPSCRI